MCPQSHCTPQHCRAYTILHRRARCHVCLAQHRRMVVGAVSPVLPSKSAISSGRLHLRIILSLIQAQARITAAHVYFTPERTTSSNLCSPVWGMQAPAPSRVVSHHSAAVIPREHIVFWSPSDQRITSYAMRTVHFILRAVQTKLHQVRCLRNACTAICIVFTTENNMQLTPRSVGNYIKGIGTSSLKM
ncbi:hypothetical protein BDW22DRAFT_28931 [Trametopsis cervina]|nr:hypothetical protein BDW22DRAFT_28931 [Trametopsis cervina]